MLARNLQRVLSAAIGVSYIAGVAAYLRYAPDGVFGGTAFVDALYASLQLFALELPRIPGRTDLPLLINLLRFVSPLSAAGALLTAFADLARTRFDLGTARRMSGHHVVVGSSPAAVEIAISIKESVADRGHGIPGRRTANRVVILADSFSETSLDRLRSKRIRVVVTSADSSDFSAALDGAAEVIVAQSDDAATLWWAAAASAELSVVSDSTSVEALLHQPIREAFGRRAGLGNIEFGSIVERVAQGAVSISPLTLRPVGPPRALVVSNGDRASSLVRAIRASGCSDTRQAVVDVIGPGVVTAGYDSKGLPVDVAVHDAEWQSAANHVIRLLEGNDQTRPIGSPVYIWTGQPSLDLEIALQVVGAKGDISAVVISEEFDLPRVEKRDDAQRVHFVDLGDAIAKGQLIGARRSDIVARALINEHRRHVDGDLSGREGQHALSSLQLVDSARPRDLPHHKVAEHLLVQFDRCGLGLTDVSATRILLSPREIRDIAISLESTVTGSVARGANAPFAVLAARIPVLLEFVGLGLVSQSVGSRLFTYEVAERIAQSIHDRYEQRFGSGQRVPLVRGEDGWAANLGQALDYPVKLAIAGFEMAATKSDDDGDWIDPALLELLAEVEHRRWCRERSERGWTYGLVRDNNAKVHPDLRPYADLDEATKDKDRLPIRDMLSILDEHGLYIVPMR